MTWEWWDDPVMVKSFIAILMLCNSRDQKWHGIEIKAGSFVTSREKLAKDFGLTVDKTRVVLSRLVKTGEIRVITTNRFTMISVNNWNRYQIGDNQKITQPEDAENQNDDYDFFDEIPSKSPANPQQTPSKSPANPHKQEYKEGENKESIEREYTEKDSTPTKKKNFVRPTLEEIKAYCQETGLSIDAEYFFDYYNSNGWKVGGKSPMKDWRATARNWSRRQRENNKTENHGGIIHEYKFRPDESGTEKLPWE